MAGQWLFGWMWQSGGEGCSEDDTNGSLAPEQPDLDADPAALRRLRELLRGPAQRVPGLEQEVLEKASKPGGSPEDKLEIILEALRSSARHLEGLQVVLRRRAGEGRATTVEAGSFPAEVQEVILSGTYSEAFLRKFDGQCFRLHREEVAPYHELQLLLEVHSGGAYWSSIPDAEGVRHRAGTTSALGGAEGSESLVTQWGAGQRGAVFAWRWRHVPERGGYTLPGWLGKALEADGDDPLKKLTREQAAIRRWEQQQRHSTAQHIRKDVIVDNRVLREVLRHWPSEEDAHGDQRLNKCAWIEGVDLSLVVGPTVSVKRVPYDEGHTYVLRASVSNLHPEAKHIPTCGRLRPAMFAAPNRDESTPLCLVTSWHWAVWSGSCGSSARGVSGWATPLEVAMPACMTPATTAAGTPATTPLATPSATPASTPAATPAGKSCETPRELTGASSWPVASEPGLSEPDSGSGLVAAEIENETTSGTGDSDDDARVAPGDGGGEGKQSSAGGAAAGDADGNDGSKAAAADAAVASEAIVVAASGICFRGMPALRADSAAMAAACRSAGTGIGAGAEEMLLCLEEIAPKAIARMEDGAGSDARAQAHEHVDGEAEAGCDDWAPVNDEVAFESSAFPPQPKMCMVRACSAPTGDVGMNPDATPAGDGREGNKEVNI